MVTSPNDETRIAAATRTLALLNQQADTVRAELASLRADLALMQHETSGIPAAQLLEANEQLVLAALRAQSIADSARRRVTELTRGQATAAPALTASASGELAQRVYQMRVDDLRDANEQLVIAALSWQELEADAKQSHSKQIKFLAMAAHELRNPLLPLRLAAQRVSKACKRCDGRDFRRSRAYRFACCFPAWLPLPTRLPADTVSRSARRIYLPTIHWKPGRDPESFLRPCENEGHVRANDSAGLSRACPC